MRFAFNLRIQVCARNERDVQEILSVLQTGEGGYDLHGPLPQSNKDHAGDDLLLWRENGEIRLMISTFTSTQAGISICALSDRAAKDAGELILSKRAIQPTFQSLAPTPCNVAR